MGLSRKRENNSGPKMLENVGSSEAQLSGYLGTLLYSSYVLSVRTDCGSILSVKY